MTKTEIARIEKLLKRRIPATKTGHRDARYIQGLYSRSHTTHKKPATRTKNRRVKTASAPKGYYANPINDYGVMVYTAKRKVYYWTGADFDSDKRLAKRYSLGTAKKEAAKVAKRYGPLLKSAVIVAPF